MSIFILWFHFIDVTLCPWMKPFFFLFDINFFFLGGNESLLSSVFSGYPFPHTHWHTCQHRVRSEAGWLPLQAAQSSSDTTLFIPCEEGKVREWVTAQTDAVYFGTTSLQPLTGANWVHVFILGRSQGWKAWSEALPQALLYSLPLSPPPCGSPLASAVQRHLHACAKLSHPPAVIPPYCACTQWAVCC